MPSLHACTASFRHFRPALAILFLLGIATTCLAGTFIAFGPTSYTRPSGSPVVVTNTFSVLNPSTQYTLKAFNGGMQNDQTELVSQTVVTLNGVQIINSTNFNSGVAELDIAVNLQATNTLIVELRGKPGGVLTIEVVGIDNDPPTIKATSSPLPNGAGWNNSSLTVTFSCSDATSGVASCPAPQTVTTEGSKAISGTATDNAGNTASTTITVNIDETAPTITASPSPAANSNGWNNSNVTVTFACADSLSGVPNCPSPITTSTESSNQVISGTSTDLGGNTASVSATINLDKTPPTISITSPANGSTFTASSVSLTGSVSDSLSGVSSVSCNGVAATIQSGTFTCSVNLSVGSNTITAQATDLAGNSSAATTNIIRTNPPSITSLNPTTGPVGASVTLTGSSFGAIQGTSTITFNNVPASPSSWSDSQIVAPVPAGTSTGNVIVTVSGVGSNALSFTVLTAPMINSLSPTSGPVGTSVVVSGVNFGATQASSTVTFNGVSATATSWSDTQIVVTVPSGAITGPILVTVAGQASNGGSGPTFAVGTPPTITAAVSPTPNANGWINSNATVTFTCTAGSSPIATCPSPQTVTSEGTNQSVSGTATDTDGTTATKAVYLNIDKTIPVLAIASPSDGSIASSATQPVSGSVSDAVSGISSVTCNGTAAPLSSGGFSCNISLNVGVNLIVVRATDLAGNVAGSNFHVSLPGTLPTPNSLQITPGTANLLIGQTQHFSAIDESGRPRADAAWTVSDTTIATISPDSSPILTAVAPGQVTLTATLQASSAQIQVNIFSGISLTAGTVRWSLAPSPGLSVQQIVQAEPVDGAPDLYAIEASSTTCFSGINVRATTSDGQQLWSRQLSGGFSAAQHCGTAASDGNGGLIVQTYANTMVDLDPQTGSTIWQYPTAGLAFAVRNDGTIFTSHFEPGPPTSFGGAVQALVALDATTGSPIFHYSIPPSFSTNDISTCNPGTLVSGSDSLASLGADSNGNVFTLVDVTNKVSGKTPSPDTQPCNGQLFDVSQNQTAYLLKVASDFSTTLTQFHSNGSLIDMGQPSTVIPEGNGGAMIFWFIYPQTYYITRVNTSSSNDLPLQYPLHIGVLPARIVLGENGIAYIADRQTVVAFNQTSGSILWNYQVSDLDSDKLNIVGATSGGGVIINDQESGLIALDANGVPGTPSGSPLPAVTPWALGNWMGSANGAMAEFPGPSTSIAASAWPFAAGNSSNESSSPKLNIATFMPIAPAAGTDNGRFNSAAGAKADLQTNIPKKIADARIYTDSTRVSPLASIPNFDLESGNPLDVLAFIGHGVYVTSTPNFAIGMLFTDNQLARTPHPDIPGLNYQITFPETTTTRDILRTSAKVIFVAACDTGFVFTTWWDMTLNAPPGGRTLIVPDFSAMAQLAVNNGIPLANSQDVDLVQGTVAWEKLVNKLNSGKTAQQAVDAANQEISAVYPTLIYPAGHRLPQIVFKLIGNPSLCLQNCP